MSTPVADLSIDLRLADIIARYLATEASRAKGVPRNVHRMDDGTEMDYPRLSVACDDRGGNKARVFIVRCSYHYGDQADHGIISDAASAAIHKTQLRLRDWEALFSFIADLPAPERTGWQILDFSYPSPGDTRREDDGDVALQATIQFRIYVQ